LDEEEALAVDLAEAWALASVVPLLPGPMSGEVEADCRGAATS